VVRGACTIFVREDLRKNSTSGSCAAKNSKA
jgi:hypothetical protein